MREAHHSDQSQTEKQEDLDIALRDSFPASDPVALTQPTTATASLDSDKSAKAGDRTRDKLLQKHERVNLSDDDEVKYWTERLGVSKTALSEAVREAGFFPADVAHHLGKTL
ncbi:DUF3606 domain-containing protein [Ferrovibrio terrae]|uniref:DUF3606 domain-containing protein n=1 Tax=Ferrovibrio terrae TaxID=2594003 RepID=UPI003137E5B3